MVMENLLPLRNRLLKDIVAHNSQKEKQNWYKALGKEPKPNHSL